MTSKSSLTRPLVFKYVRDPFKGSKLHLQHLPSFLSQVPLTLPDFALNSSDEFLRIVSWVFWIDFALVSPKQWLKMTSLSNSTATLLDSALVPSDKLLRVSCWFLWTLFSLLSSTAEFSEKFSESGWIITSVLRDSFGSSVLFF